MITTFHKGVLNTFVFTEAWRNDPCRLRCEVRTVGTGHVVCHLYAVTLQPEEEFLNAGRFVKFDTTLTTFPTSFDVKFDYVRPAMNNVLEWINDVALGAWSFHCMRAINEKGHSYIQVTMFFEYLEDAILFKLSLV